MQPKSKTFRVEIGINLHAAPVAQTNPNMRIFPLQHALIDLCHGPDAEPKAAWYSRLCFGDEISFRLVDTTGLRVPSYEPDYPDLVVAKLLFADPMTGQEANPFTQRIFDWRLSERSEDQSSPVFCLDPTHRLPTWDLIGHNIEGEEFRSLVFAQEGEQNAARSFELTMVLKMLREGWVNHYVFDPEMIVSETDNEGDGSGGKRRH